MNVSLPNGNTGVMCDSTGHNSFSSFDDTLVLWGGGNPGASCGDKKEDRESVRQMRSNSRDAAKTQGKKTLQTNFRNSFQL